MTAYNSSYTGAEHDAYVSKTALVDLIYPVGSIYMSVNTVSPATLFGGTWEAIQDKFLLCSGNTYASGSTGGEATHTLTVAETPAHTHSRGTMDITGMIQTWTDYNQGNSAFDTNCISGAFHFTTGTDWEQGMSTNGASGSNDAQRRVKFTASRTWSGATSSVGSGNAHNNMPPYLTVNVWKRTA